ncbi:YnfC family lipoprotein, partial [Escherichia coli]|uniref:YnfC family lipoprotein n=1 Tax=Escherichia coli TaxID=562 RepID=UPI000CC8A889
GKTTKSNDTSLSVSATPSTDPIKKLDYTSVTLLNTQRDGNVKQSCEYDIHANVVDCPLIIVDEGAKPAV